MVSRGCILLDVIRSNSMDRIKLTITKIKHPKQAPLIRLAKTQIINKRPPAPNVNNKLKIAYNMEINFRA